MNWRGFGPLLAAQLVSNSGSQMTAVALPWFVLTTTRSPAQASWVVAAEFAAIGLLGLPGGALAQRIGPRRTMLIADPARALLIALVPALHLLGLLTFPLLLAIVFAMGAFFTPCFSSQQAILPDLMGERAQELTGAGALFQTAHRLPNVVGPAVAGTLMAFIQPTDVLFIDAATYLAAFGFIRLLVPAVAGKPAQLHHDLLAGVRFLAGNRVLRNVTLTSTLGEAGYQALLIAIPVLVLFRYGQHPEIAGALLAAWGVGAGLGSVAGFGSARKLEPLRQAKAAMFLQALPLWLLATTAPVPVLATAMFLAGVFNPLTSAPIHALRLLRSPVELRATVTAVWVTVVMLAGVAGLALAGPAMQSVGVQPVLLACAALITGRAVGLWLSLRGEPALETMRQQLSRTAVQPSSP